MPLRKPLQNLTGLLICLAVLMLAGCGFQAGSLVQHRDRDYLQAKSIPPLKIPPGVAAERFENKFPIPAGDHPAYTKTVDLIPPELGTGK